MHPVDHARSTAVWLGQPAAEWHRFVVPHDWLDASKAFHARIQHRALRHHVEGISWLVAEMGREWAYRDTVSGLDTTVSLQEMAERHLREDVSMDGLPSIEDWLRDMKPPVWIPLPAMQAPDAMAASTSARYGGDPAKWVQLHAWFMEDFGCIEKFGDMRHLCIRNHAAGVFDAERRFGHLIDGVPVRVVAERHVLSLLGHIPDASSWLGCLPILRWMSPSPHRVSDVRRRIMT